MKRILTGIQSSGRPHLGNILGAILPALELTKQKDKEGFFFIADWHALTSIKDGAQIRQYSLEIAASWLACGLDPNEHVFYRQSKVSCVSELAWYLNCFAPYPMLANAHSFKDKSKNLSDVNVGLFTYPVLMAADILLYDSECVPVGKDQKQHLEMTRDIAKSFNHKYGDTFIVPEAKISEHIMTIPGTDGEKMSKSYGNTIDILGDPKQLKKQVMSIKTDSTPLEDPKDPDNCTVFQLYSCIAQEEEINKMRAQYEAGNYGYGTAKKALLNSLQERFAEEVESFSDYMSKPNAIEDILEEGEKKASLIAEEVLDRVREKLSY